MSIDIGIVTMSICPELKRQPWPTCRCAVSGSGPASALRMSWTPTGNSGETGPEFPCLQICSAGSRELCTAGPPGYQSFHLQHQSRPDSPKGPGWNLPITSYLGHKWFGHSGSMYSLTTTKDRTVSLALSQQLQQVSIVTAALYSLDG